MKVKVVFLALLLLSACGMPATQLEIEPIEATSTSALAPSEPTEPTHQVLDEEAPIVLHAELEPPPVFFIQGNTVLKQVPGEMPVDVFKLPDRGPAKSALLVGNQLFILREEGLNRLDLADGSDWIVFQTDSIVRFGELVPGRQMEQVLYSIVVDDPRAEFGFSTVIGLYDSNKDVAQTVLTFPYSARVLGLTPDARGLYILPYGQDPEFGSVLLVSLERNEVIKELAVEGFLFASLSPDGRRLATTTSFCIECERPENILNLYDIPSLPLTPARMIELPESNSQIAGLSWSSEPDRLVFLTRRDPPGDSPALAYSLWKLDTVTGEILQINAIQDVNLRMVTISPGGRWLLLGFESRPDFLLVNLLNGSVQPFTGPSNALIVDWD